MSADRSPATEQQDRSPGDERWYLTDERDFLRRSLADADREREAGDLSVEDHALLVARDRARLAEVEEELAALDAAAPSTDLVGDADAVGRRRDPRRRPSAPRWPLWRRLGIVGRCLLIAVGAVSWWCTSCSPASPARLRREA